METLTGILTEILTETSMEVSMEIWTEILTGISAERHIAGITTTAESHTGRVLSLPHTRIDEVPRGARASGAASSEFITDDE